MELIRIGVTVGVVGLSSRMAMVEGAIEPLAKGPPTTTTRPSGKSDMPLMVRPFPGTVVTWPMRIERELSTVDPASFKMCTWHQPPESAPSPTNSTPSELRYKRLKAPPNTEVPEAIVSS